MFYHFHGFYFTITGIKNRSFDIPADDSWALILLSAQQWLTKDPAGSSDVHWVGMFPTLPLEKFKQIGNAAGAGARQMLAVIGDSANLASIGVHRSLGFRQVGVLQASGWKFDRWLDVVFMQRELGLGAGAPA